MPLTGRPAYLADAKAHIVQLDKTWMKKVPETDRSRAPWMPFNRSEFMDLMYDAFNEAPGNQFLAIGCGPGSDLIQVREFWGFDVTGIEVEPGAAAAAREIGLDVRTADAAEFARYGEFDLIWFNRVFRDPGLQTALEKKVWEDMAPGAVVMCANLEAPPPPDRFFEVVNDWELRRGAWYKIR